MPPNQLLINKRQIRFFKFILMSPQLEQISLFSYLFIFLLILLFFSTRNFHSNYFSSPQKALTIQDQAYFLNNISIPRFLDYLSSQFQTNYLNSTNNYYKLLGGIRITQYRLNRPSQCYDLNSMARFSIDCNPFFANDWSDHQESLIELPQDKSLCIESSCLEFNVRYLDFGIRSTKWQTYPETTLFVNLPLTGLQENLEKLKENEWLSENETVCIVFEFNNIDLRFFNVISIQIYLEMPAGFNNQITIKTHNLMMRTNESILFLVIVPTYLVIMILLSVKGIFELSYFSNKFTCVCNILTYLGNLFLAVCLVLENSQYQFIFFRDWPQNYSFFLNKEFLPLNNIVFYKKILDFMFFLCLIPYPFKLLELLTWYKGFQFIEKFINSLYRTLLGFSLYFFTFFIVCLSWSLGFYIFFRDYESDFDSFFHSLINFLFSKTNFENSKNRMSFFSIEILKLNIKTMRIAILGYFIAILVFCVFKASSFDYSHYYFNKDKELNEGLISISQKIDKFERKYLPNLQQDFNNKSMKIIVWLSSGNLSYTFQNEIIELCSKNDIKLLIFSEVSQIIQFMKYLFKLKPNLAFQSESFFRIMLEFPQKDLEFNLKHEIILKWLQEYRSRAPVIIFSEKKFENLKGILQRIYKFIYLTQWIDDVRDFMLFRRISEIKFNRTKIDTTSEIDSSIRSHSFEYINEDFN